jgi:hypothetical protein
MDKIKVLSVEIDGKIYDLREGQRQETEKQNDDYIKPDGKRCGRCLKVKPTDAFNNDKSQKDGLQGWCKDCKNEYARDYQKVLQKRNKKRLYMQEYNKRKKSICLTPNILEEQNIKPDTGVIDGTVPDAIPVTPLSSVDEKAVDSVIGDPEKRKRFHW